MPELLSRHIFHQSRDRSRLAYRMGGSIGDVPVVLLHAMAARANTWEKVAAALIGAGRQVIVPDLRGHGCSTRAASYPLSDFSDDIIALLDHLELPEVDLVGHSLGGFVALTVAQQAPGRVRRLLIEDAPIPPRGAAEADMLRIQQSKRGVVATLSPVQMAAILFWRRFHLRMARSLIVALRAPMPSWWEGLGAITANTLLLGGAQSSIKRDRIARLAAAIPNARMQMIAGGHHLHSRHLVAFLDAAMPFLDDRRSAIPSRDDDRWR